MKPEKPPFLSGAEFAELVAHGAEEITPATVHRLCALLPSLREKFPEVQAHGFPKAPAQLAFLADVVEALVADEYRDLPYAAVSGAAFALLYLARDLDVIPDFVEESGFLDDASVAATVLRLHAREFGEFAARRGADWTPLDPDAP